jgi:hypothetical protein
MLKLQIRSGRSFKRSNSEICRFLFGTEVGSLRNKVLRH